MSKENWLSLIQRNEKGLSLVQRKWSVLNLVQKKDTRLGLKVPKCEIFDRSDFHDFYPIKSLWEGDFGVKIKCFKKYI